jgi:hypothetical protein
MERQFLEESKISNKYLKNFNLVMFFLHFIQATAMLVFSLVIDDIRNFKLPITTAYLAFDEFAIPPLQPFYRDIFNPLVELPVGILVSSFLFLSALAHFLISVPFNKAYNRGLDKHVNYFRWFEYALSSSVMIVLIAMFFGVYDLSSLVLMFGANATMNLMGLMMEIHNQTTKKTRWIAFNIGWVVGLLPWLIIILYLLGNNASFSEVPWFVWAIFFSYGVLFFTFPINMFLQYRKKGRFQDYRFGERGYVILSLIAKTLLAWLVFAGVLQPS